MGSEYTVVVWDESIRGQVYYWQGESIYLAMGAMGRAYEEGHKYIALEWRPRTQPTPEEEA